MKKEEQHPNFRYFKIIKPLENISCFSDIHDLEEGDIIQLSNYFFERGIFNSNFLNKVRNWIEPWNILHFGNDEPFDFMKYIYAQKPMVFTDDITLTLIFDENDVCYINKWLKEKIYDNAPHIGWLNGTTTIKSHNEYELSQLYDSEKGILLSDTKLIEGNTIEKLSFPITYGASDTFNIFKSTGQTVRLAVPVKKGEEWHLSNPAVALALFEQDFIRLLAVSEEILGKEKEEIIINETQDYVPNTTIKYYKIKEGIKITKEDMFSDLSGANFNSYLVKNYSSIIICDFNKNNFNEDGTIKYFSIKFHHGMRDNKIEKELAKIATCLPSEEALEKLNEDMEAIHQHEKEQEAIEFVKKNMNKYKKGTNRLLSPIEFMEQEQRKEREQLGKRLIKTLYKRMEDLQ